MFNWSPIRAHLGHFPSVAITYQPAMNTAGWLFLRPISVEGTEQEDRANAVDLPRSHYTCNIPIHYVTGSLELRDDAMGYQERPFGPKFPQPLKKANAVSGDKDLEKEQTLVNRNSIMFAIIK